MTFTLRPVQVPADYPRMAALLSKTSGDPVTAEQLQRNDTLWGGDGIRRRTVAVTSDGFVAGFGTVRHNSGQKPGRFWAKVMVEPGYRGRGMGTALLADLEGFAREQGATRFETMVKEDEPASLAFARAHGYVTDRHLFESWLDLSTFDEARFAGVVERVAASGIRIFPLSEAADEAGLRRFYDLVWATAADTPGYDMASPPPYETWGTQVLKGPDTRLDCLLVAADGDRWVGEMMMLVNKVDGSILNGGTGVLAEYRGRGIALALKLAGIRIARAIGAHHMKTQNDSENAPMLAVNRKLGYVPVPGYYEMKKII